MLWISYIVGMNSNDVYEINRLYFYMVLMCMKCYRKFQLKFGLTMKCYSTFGKLKKMIVMKTWAKICIGQINKCEDLMGQ